MFSVDVLNDDLNSLFSLLVKLQNLNKSRRQREFGDGQRELHTGALASPSPSDDEDVILSSLRSASANGQSISLSVRLLTRFGVPLGRPTHPPPSHPVS